MNRQQAQEIVAKAYRDFLHREPDYPAAEHWVMELMAGGKSEAWIRENLGKTDEAILVSIRENYGGYASLLDIPEIKDLLFKAARDEWSTEKFVANLKGTGWWKTNADSIRKWDILLKSDPASANQMRAVRREEIVALGEPLGIVLTEQRISFLTEESLRMGWDGQQLERAVRAEFDFVSGQQQNLQGVISVTFDAMKTAAAQWGVPLSDEVTEQWLEQIIREETTMDAFAVYLKEQAMGRFPGIAHLIQQGRTPEQVFDPYRNRAAELLGLNPQAITFSDPKWGRALGYVDPQSGQMRMMDMYQWEKTIKQDAAYGWKHTQGAVDEATEFALRLGKIFGEVPA